ncbi:MAG: hypothetical protein KUG69_13100 [Marinosulfonomonas sp.]|nr:hypothetical protein [Marinosulfonomonas sp.]
MSGNETLRLASEVENTPIQSDAPRTPAKRRLKLRHFLVMLSFLAIVVGPTAIGTGYLFTRATNQYHSLAAFSVSSEEFSNPLEILSAFTQTGGSSAPDSEILYDFIRSQTVIERIDAVLNLRSIFNRPENDPFFALGEDRSIEELIDYWDRMVSVSIDSSTGVLEIEVRAFSAEDATKVLTEIINQSSTLVDDLSRIAQSDAMKFTLEDLGLAEERLKLIRRRIRDFRTEHQIIDPEADVQSQIGVVSALQSELASALVSYEMIYNYSNTEDPRLVNLKRRIDAIRSQIASERNLISSSVSGNKPLSEIIGEFEELLVDLEFSQNTYSAALVSEEQARLEARRKSRYLSVHIPPTTAQESVYPERYLLSALLLACAFAAWGVLVMIYYNVRDRR